MIFTTLEFFLFFLVFFTFYWAIAGRRYLRLCFLTLGSFAFYAAWDYRFVALITAAIVVTHAGARFGRTASWVKMACISILLGLLGFFKYFDFFAFELARFFSLTGLFQDSLFLNVVLPVGISFYIFQGISMIMDASRDPQSDQPSLLETAAYLSFFPQLVAGPIVRSHELLPYLRNPIIPDGAQLAWAGQLIIMGLIKKLTIANYLATQFVDPIWAAGPQDALEAWLASIAYAAQIFCDFSGYSDLAVGFSLLLGIRLPQNFNAPYGASSFQDFWKGWHITLSRWVRDYLYIPLGGNRLGPWRRGVNLMITMGLAGLWHGANWTFMIWGLSHGLLLVLTRNIRLGIIPVFILTTLLWIPFRAPNLSLAVEFMAMLAGPISNMPDIPIHIIFVLCWGIILAMIPQHFAPGRVAQFLGRSPMVSSSFMILIIWVVFALAPPGVAPFIYFQF
ncbi:MAG TPA: MBOAT family protein [Alphaproteobacteria bacterium]|nr:MBOAT family protein [Alphaproteobacteria bacterium]|tara:strand:- start:1 stop:1350 length:1350 start_codon:yes stop_codon:yes gene_type:complete